MKVSSNENVGELLKNIIFLTNLLLYESYNISAIRGRTSKFIPNNKQEAYI